MGLTALLAVAVALAMDAFAVCVAAGASGRSRGPRAAFRLSFHFGLFQALMPVLGWLGGQALVIWLHGWHRLLAAVLLAVIGLRMIVAAAREDSVEAARARSDPSRGWSLVALSVGTSIDALAVGVSFSMLEISIIHAAATIGFVAAGLSLAGLRFGQLLGARFGSRAEIPGGLILIAVALKVVLA